MLTGLLPASEGEALLFGKPVDPHDMQTRQRVGYMSQAFSLYSELTVRQNLDLHARLFHLPAERRGPRVQEMLERFDLTGDADSLPSSLPLGVRQRLSLAVAVIHNPEILILDEPTSGVDPVARDRFWELLVQRSREDGVTIFISTHFMNEAERCDRISLMHAGKVLAQGAPTELVETSGTENLEETFISYLQQTSIAEFDTKDSKTTTTKITKPTIAPGQPRQQRLHLFDLRRAWAYAYRESMEIRRDPIRLAVALLGPIIMMIVFGYGITLDIENIPYAVRERDRTPESRAYLENYNGSRYCNTRTPLNNHAEMEHRLRRGELTLIIEIPPEFGIDLKRNRQPEVGIWLDASIPFRAETARGYVLGLHQFYLESLARDEFGKIPEALPLTIQTRFRYNQDFESVFAMVPGSIMLLLIWIPAMMTAVGVVREKEMGSITNFYATPVTGLEFLLGKQFPYLGLAPINFICLVLLAVF